MESLVICLSGSHMFGRDPQSSVIFEERECLWKSKMQSYITLALMHAHTQYHQNVDLQIVFLRAPKEAVWSIITMRDYAPFELVLIPLTTNMVWRSTKPSAGVEVGLSEEATERMWLLPKISFPKDGEIFKPADPKSSTFMSPYWLVPKAKDSCRANLEPHQDIVQVALGDEAPVPFRVPTLTNPGDSAGPSTSISNRRSLQR